MGKYSSKKDTRSNLKVDLDTWNTIENLKDGIRRRTGKRPSTAQAIQIAVTAFDPKSEQVRMCTVCKSASYAGCNHVQILGIDNSVLKAEQSFTQGYAPGEDEVNLIETWRRAKDVGISEWKEMLLSIRRQLELVARAADREKELLAMAESHAQK